MFWLYCVVGVALAVALPMRYAEPLYDRGFPIWGFIGIAVLEIAYLIWAHVSLWMCAFNTSHRYLAYAARVYACAALLYIVIPPVLYTSSSSRETEVMEIRPGR